MRPEMSACSHILHMQRSSSMGINFSFSIQKCMGRDHAPLSLGSEIEVKVNVGHMAFG
jgi:hypothetical protein